MMEEIQILAENLGNQLKSSKKKIATAESCTGGGLGFWITSIAGSSAWYDRGFITYSNQAKLSMLGVSNNTLDVFGAVSEQTAREMAEGALSKSDASCSIAITGIAGPDGGSQEKPIGTVWLAYADNKIETVSELEIFSGDRHTVRLAVIKRALERALDLF